MPLALAPATVKLSFFYSLLGQPAMNRIHVSVPPTLPSEGLCSDLAVAAGDWWDTNVKALVTNQMTLNEVHVMSLAEENGPQASFSAGLPLAGTQTADPCSGNVAFCVSFRTGLTGRSARGRWYWCGLIETQTVGNEVAGGTVTSILGAMDNLLSTISGLGFSPIILSYISGGAPRVGGPVKFIINDAIAVDNIIDTQRGRLH